VNLDKAIIKIGKAMGKAKYHDYMGGAMLPDGNLNAAQTIALLFNISSDEVNNRLNRIMNTEHKKIIDEQCQRVKKSEMMSKKKKKKK